MENQKQTKKQVRRIRYIVEMLAKYAHRWGENPSQRMQDWVDELNDLIEKSEAWKVYCEQRGWERDHKADAYDFLA